MLVLRRVVLRERYHSSGCPRLLPLPSPPSLLPLRTWFTELDRTTEEPLGGAGARPLRWAGLREALTAGRDLLLGVAALLPRGGEGAERMTDSSEAVRLRMKALWWTWFRLAVWWLDEEDNEGTVVSNMKA